MLVLTHPDFSPVALQLGPLSIKWYGLMYLVAFGLFFYLGRYRARTQSWHGVSPQLVDDLLFYGVLGVILGGRLGYVLFYKPGYYASRPLEILEVWMGGMSFHGGFLGALVAIWLVARKHRIDWWRMADFVAPLVPCGLAAGRLGNFINGELWGRVTDVPWGMVFRHASGGPRHPSQLYQFALEGIALFVILWIFTARRRPAGAASGVFLTGYGIFRFIAEYFREPDDFLGLLAFNMSMGQWLSLPMVALGIMLLTWAYRREGAAL